MFRVVFILFFALIGACQAQWTEMVFNGNFDHSRGTLYGWHYAHRSWYSNTDYVSAPRSAGVYADSGIIYQEPPELAWPYRLDGPGVFMLRIQYFYKAMAPCSISVRFTVYNKRTRLQTRYFNVKATGNTWYTSWKLKDTTASFSVADTEFIGTAGLGTSPMVVLGPCGLSGHIALDNVSVGYQWVPTGVESQEPVNRLPTAFLRSVGTYNILGQKVEYLRRGQVGFVVRSDGSVKKIVNLR